jgi:hypothetical protein
LSACPYCKKNEKACPEENVKGVAVLPLDKEITGLHQEKHSQLGEKEMETE